MTLIFYRYQLSQIRIYEILHLYHSNLYYYNDFYVKMQSEINHLSENLFYPNFYYPFFYYFTLNEVNNRV